MIPINVMPSTDPSVISIVNYGMPSVGAQQTIAGWLDTAYTNLSQQGQQYLSQAKETWKRFTDGGIERALRHLSHTAINAIHPNMVMSIDNYSGMQMCNEVTQRYIMALPDIRQYYHRQLCDGYSGSYVDCQPNDIGVMHDDYCEVMQGEVITKDVDGEEFMSIRMYPCVTENDRALCREDRHIMRTNWNLALAAIYDKVDPTDIFNGELGKL